MQVQQKFDSFELSNKNCRNAKAEKLYRKNNLERVIVPGEENQLTRLNRDGEKVSIEGTNKLFYLKKLSLPKLENKCLANRNSLSITSYFLPRIKNDLRLLPKKLLLLQVSNP